MSDSTTVPPKRCFVCGEDKPATPEYFRIRKDTITGLRAECKQCQHEKQSKRHAEQMQDPEYRNRQHQYQRKSRQKPEVRERQRASSILRLQKPEVKQRLQEYAKSPQNRQRQRDYMRKRRFDQAVKERQREYDKRRLQDPRVQQRLRQWRLEYRQRSDVQERIREYNKKLWQDPEYRERQRLYNLQWRQSHPEYQERKRVYCRLWSKKPENKRRIKHYCVVRRAREKSLPATFTAQDWQNCLDYFNHCCAVCGKPAGLWHILAQDHWIALNDKRPDNPGTVPWNIVPLCNALKDGRNCCNNTKHDKDPEIWLIEQFGAKKATVILARINTYFEWVSQTI